MERGSRKRSSSAGSEKMKRVGRRYENMEGHCSTGQSPRWAIVPMEEEEEEVYIYIYIHTVMNTTILQLVAIYKIQLHVSALYIGHHQVVQRT